MNAPKLRHSKKRLVFIGLAAAGIVLGALAWFHFGVSRPVGNGPAGPKVSATLFEEAWTTQPVLLLGLGDSVTAGFGARKGYSYFDRLEINPPDEFEEMKGLCLSAVLPGLRATNMSVSGSTSLNHIKTIMTRLEAQPSNVLGIVVITTGGNDIIHNYGQTPPKEGAMYGARLAEAELWIENFNERLGEILSGIKRTFPGGCHIFLANIYDPTDGLGDTEKAGLPRWPDALAVLDRYNRIIAEHAERNENVHLVDIHTAFLGHGIHCTQFWREHYHRDDPHYWFHTNLEDPNERGYDALRRLFLLKIAEELYAMPDSSEK